VNLLETRSFFRWEGAFCKEIEDFMVIKTEKDKVPALMKRIRELHTYQIPEMVVISIIGGYDPYLGWLHQEVNR
jgi:periplasmic divalent cation tolerance protein